MKILKHFDVLLVYISIEFILIYRLVAPDFIRRSCRFNPSCSEYSIRALRKYGFLKGVAKTAGRIIRCCPPNKGIDNP